MELNLNIKAITAPPSLKTERLLLVPVSEELKPFVFINLSSPGVRKMNKMPCHNTPEKQENWWGMFESWRKSGQAVQWCGFNIEDDTFIGLFTFKGIQRGEYRAEIGYSIIEEQWGKGYGSEGVKCMVDYGFEQIGLHSIFASILSTNFASQNLIKRVGFEQEGFHKHEHFYEGQFYNLLQFSKINPHH